jgi:hypothetical protein
VEWFRRRPPSLRRARSTRPGRDGSNGPAALKQLRPNDVRVARIERHYGVAIATLTDRSLPLDPDLMHDPPP